MWRSTAFIWEGGTFICSDLHLAKTVQKMLFHWFKEGCSWCIGTWRKLFVVVCSILVGVPFYESFSVHSACKDRIYHYHSNSKWLNMPQFMVEWFLREDRPVDLQFELTQLTQLIQLSWVWLAHPSLPPLFVARDRCSRGLHTHVDGCSKVLLHINYPCVPYLVNGPWLQRYEWVEQRGNKVPLLVNIQPSKPNCWLCAIFELPTAGCRMKCSQILK